MSVFNAIASVFVCELQQKQHQQQQQRQQQTVTCNELSEAGVEMQVKSTTTIHKTRSRIYGRVCTGTAELIMKYSLLQSLIDASLIAIHSVRIDGTNTC